MSAGNKTEKRLKIETDDQHVQCECWSTKEITKGKMVCIGQRDVAK